MKKNNNFEEKVKEVLADVKKDDLGKVILPENVDEAVAYAVKTELRRKDTQAEYTRARQKVKTLEAEKEKLAKKWEEDYIKSHGSLTSEMQILKETDPDEYITKSIENSKLHHKNFEEVKASITKEASKEAELARREIILEEYNAEFPNNPITDEVIQRDLPPRLYMDLESGKIDFATFVAKAGKILNATKVIKTPAAEDTPSFNSVASSNTNNSDIVRSHENDYKKMIF